MYGRMGSGARFAGAIPCSVTHISITAKSIRTGMRNALNRVLVRVARITKSPPSRAPGLFVTAPEFQLGDVVEGRYQIIRKLADGGMGTVYLAEHVLIRRRVALKLLHAELASDSAMVRRFMNEASAAGTLGHPHIVESTDMGFTRNGIPYIVFEYLEGTLLIEEVYRLGGLPVRRALQIASQIASALEAAHNARIVHLDLKSDNVFLIDRGDAVDHVKVLDFGISRFLELDLDSGQRGQLAR